MTPEGPQPPRASAPDCGAYLLLLELRRDRRIRVGRLGRIAFRKGWHVYVGSAMGGLAKRIARHLRRRKRLHWHVDHLREAADGVAVVALPSDRRQECALAAALGEVLAPGPRGFGCSDCACPTHLFWSARDPRGLPSFHGLLVQFGVGGLDSD